MTEEEAKTKWCPMGTVVAVTGNGKVGKCIGSACMAWRWADRFRALWERGYEDCLEADQKDVVARLLEEGKDTTGISNPSGPKDRRQVTVYWHEKIGADGRGYCGLASHEGQHQ